MAAFPSTPAFTGFNTPSRIEADIADLAHEGEIPRELNGAFYRVQPDPQFPPHLGDDISFNGDGMISRFRFHDGRCDFRQRWARTAREGDPEPFMRNPPVFGLTSRNTGIASTASETARLAVKG